MKSKKLARLGLLVLSLSFVIYGSLRGEVVTVLQKAIRLCLECIGIG